MLLGLAGCGAVVGGQGVVLMEVGFADDLDERSWFRA